MRIALALAALVVLQPWAWAAYANASDLVTAFPYPHAVGDVGTTIKLLERTSNLGNETAPSSSTIVESLPDNGRTWLHKPQIPGYSFREDTFNYTCFAAGNFQLVAVADYYDIVNETNESNNRGAMEVTCNEPRVPRNHPDLLTNFGGAEIAAH